MTQGQALRPRAQEAPRDAAARQGLPRRRQPALPHGQGGGAEGRPVPLPRPAQPQARLPPRCGSPASTPPRVRTACPIRSSCTAWSSPASSWTARSWPTSPSATPTPFDALPTAPARRWRPAEHPAEATSTAKRAPLLTGRAPFLSVPDASHHKPTTTESSRRSASSAAPALARALGPVRGRGRGSAGRRRRRRLAVRRALLRGRQRPAGGGGRARAAGVGLGARLGHARAGGLPGAVGGRPAGRCASTCTASTTPATSARCCARAEAFGASCVALGPGSADPFGPKAVRASMGAVFAVPRRQARHRHASRRQGRAGRPATGVPLRELGASECSAEITPADRRRARRPPAELVDSADRTAHIPIHTDSLNAAMAATSPCTNSRLGWRRA